MKQVTVGEKKVYVYEKILPENICREWIERINNLTSARGSNSEFADEIFQTIQKLIGTFPVTITKNRPEVTHSTRAIPIGEHYDEKIGNETWKVICYLNEVKNGGTEFYSGTEWINVEGNLGTVVLFDISLLHRGQRNQERKAKYSVGVRLE